MTREEFYTAIESFLSENKIGEKLIPRELVAELSERLAKLSLPPAEGAEEILDDIAARIDSSVLSDNRDMIKEFYRNKLNTLATLHAQRLADKMVSERLRKELMMFGDYFNNLDPNDHILVNHILVNDIDEYLKSKER